MKPEILGGKNRAVFLDRDGTINIDKNYLYKIEDFEFVDGTIDALRIIQDKGYIIIIVTNQSGIARGFYSEDDYLILSDWLVQELKKNGINIGGTYYCPHLPDAQIVKYRKNCTCRKPGTDLFRRATSDLNIDINESVAIGDKLRDCYIALESQCRGFLIGVNEKPEIIKDICSGKYPNIRYLPTLLDVANDL